MESSYKRNNYGEVFDAIVDAFKPVNVVELGILQGYSTFHIAKRLKMLGRGDVNAYDLFEDYPYKHANFEDVKNMFKHCENVTINKADAWQVHELYNDQTVDMLHVDLSNTGETIKKTMEHWDSKMVYGGIILFEGGTEERDQEPWMIKYNAPSIKKEIETNEIINTKYIYGTYLKWPGLTMLLKKR